MILVVGATGGLGRAISDRLVTDGRSVRAFVRAGSHESPSGAQAVRGDLTDRASLDQACAGVDTVVATATAAGRGGSDTLQTVDDQGYADLIDAAVAAGVARFAYISALGADPDSRSPLLRAKGRTEQRLRDSGMRFTILQPDVYMDLLIPIVLGAAFDRGAPVPLVLGGTRRHSWVARNDVAALATGLMGRPDSEGKTYVVGGPEPISWQRIVSAAAATLGRSIQTVQTEPGAAVPGLPPFVNELITTLEMYDSVADASPLALSLGLDLTPIEGWMQEFMRSTHLSRA